MTDSETQINAVIKSAPLFVGEASKQEVYEIAKGVIVGYATSDEELVDALKRLKEALGV